MIIKLLDCDFSVCQIDSETKVDYLQEYTFISTTDQEISLVCPTINVPENTKQRSDHWKAFRIEGVLEFALVGILAKIATILAENQISIFAISTFNTDYILTKADVFDKAILILKKQGYEVIE